MQIYGANIEINIELERKRVKMEMIRMAKEIVMENKKLLPIQSKSITPDDLIEFSEKLFEYYNN